MNANELRIGNSCLVEDDYHILIEKHVTASDILNFDNGDIDIQPIQLTEDILLKFGAKKQYYNLTFEYDRFRLSWKQSYNFWYVVDKETNAYLNKIEFVHEWQNFVFVMNGNEL